MRELLRRYAIRFDLHLVTPKEVTSACGQPHGFLSSVLASSETLYKEAKRRNRRNKGLDNPGGWAYS